LRQAHDAERTRRRKEEELAIQGGRRSPPGTLIPRNGKRIVSFEPDDEEFAGLNIPGHPGIWNTWVAFGPPDRRERLWTVYDVEGSQDDGVATPSEGQLTPTIKKSMSASLLFANPKLAPPVCSLLVIDFAQPYYLSPSGKKKIEQLLAEIRNVIRITHRNLVSVYAVKVNLKYRSSS
jgi:hypothetical protein